MWRELGDWLDEKARVIDADQNIPNDPEKIKQLIAKHKEFQRTLGAKQPAYDAVTRFGRHLKDKSPKQDGQPLQEMMTDSKTKWNNICAKSVDR